jgi:hypothetical protein
MDATIGYKDQLVKSFCVFEPSLLTLMEKLDKILIRARNIFLESFTKADIMLIANFKSCEDKTRANSINRMIIGVAKVIGH